MTLVDYVNLNYFLSNQIINPFDQHYDFDDDFPSEAELLCLDPLPPSLFDFDFDVPLFNPPPPPPPPPPPTTPPLQLDYHFQDNLYDYDYDELLIVPEKMQYSYSCIDDYLPPLNLPTEDHSCYYNNPFEEEFSGEFLPFPKKQKLSFPSFDPFSSEIHGVSECGVVDSYNHWSNNHNVGGGEFNYDGCVKYSGGCGGGGGGKVKEKEVSAQSKAARERRKKIAEKTQELGKLVPGGTKMNTAEMLHSGFKYVQFLQAQLGLLNSIKSLHQENDEKANFDNLSILGSQLVQEKLLAKEKCLVPMDLLPMLEKQLNCETDPSISNQIKELLH